MCGHIKTGCMQLFFFQKFFCCLQNEFRTTSEVYIYKKKSKNTFFDSILPADYLSLSPLVRLKVFKSLNIWRYIVLKYK